MTREPDPARAAPAVDDGSEMERLASDVLPALIARLGTSRLGELEVRGSGWRVRLRREIGPAADGTPSGAPARSGGGHGSSRPDSDRHVTRSPAVGYFSPGTPLAVGLAVRSGDILGHVDVLGVRREVVASADGVVGRILVEPGQAVEYGQELVLVDAPAGTPAPSAEPSGGDEPAEAMTDAGVDDGATAVGPIAEREPADEPSEGTAPADRPVEGR